MPRFLMVLLRHDASTGSHHDWLLVDPRTAADPDARLWTARLKPPTDRWAELGAFEIELIAPHRREYLAYEGPLSPDAQGNDRGRVTRVDEGTFESVEWTDARIVLDAAFRRFRGRLVLQADSNGRWRARVERG